jgi:hypothetical protein
MNIPLDTGRPRRVAARQHTCWASAIPLGTTSSSVAEGPLRKGVFLSQHIAGPRHDMTIGQDPPPDYPLASVNPTIYSSLCQSTQVNARLKRVE